MNLQTGACAFHPDVAWCEKKGNEILWAWNVCNNECPRCEAGQAANDTSSYNDITLEVNPCGRGTLKDSRPSQAAVPTNMGEPSAPVTKRAAGPYALAMRKRLQLDCEVLERCPLSHTRMPDTHEQGFQMELVLAEAGDARAQKEVANRLRVGVGASQDKQASLNWIKKAIGKGNLEADTAYASMWMDGSGQAAVRYQEEMGIFFSKKADRQGCGA
jgi:TPR repeat protein